MDFLIVGNIREKKRYVKLDFDLELEEKTFGKIEAIAKRLGMMGISQYIGNAIMAYTDAHYEEVRPLEASYPEVS